MFELSPPKETPAASSNNSVPNLPRDSAEANPDWSNQDSKITYGIDNWSGGYFDVAPNGNLTITAPGAGQPIELLDIVEGLKQRGLEMPVMLRIENLLSDRVTQLNRAFGKAIVDSAYQGRYRGVFPIKVNQQNHVVTEIAKFGEPYGHGLEAGSKAELLIAMSTLQAKDSLIVCNGYKDEEFIDLGLQATRIGFKCFFVLETPTELALILNRAKYWGIAPRIGVRLKLSTKVDGHWAGDSGDRSLFGLSTQQLIEVVDHLKETSQLDCLQLLHFHLGSQIPNIRNIRDGVSEACRYYVDLVKEGAASITWTLAAAWRSIMTGPAVLRLTVAITTSMNTASTSSRP